MMVKVKCPKCGNMVTTSCTTTCTCHKCKTVMHIDSYGKIRREIKVNNLLLSFY